jgi:hypothetical protein
MGGEEGVLRWRDAGFFGISARILDGVDHVWGKSIQSPCVRKVDTYNPRFFFGI